MTIQADPTILTFASGLLVIFVMLMGLMLQILRRLDGLSDKAEANTLSINSLAAWLDTRTAELDAKIDTRTAEIITRIAVNGERIDLNRKRIDDNRKSIDLNRERIDDNRKSIDLNSERIDDNRTRIDSCMGYLREFRIETRENFEQIRTRIEKLDDRPTDTR